MARKKIMLGRKIPCTGGVIFYNMDSEGRVVSEVTHKAVESARHAFITGVGSVLDVGATSAKKIRQNPIAGLEQDGWMLNLDGMIAVADSYQALPPSACAAIKALPDNTMYQIYNPLAARLSESPPFCGE
jgi:hypothetical protein